MMRTLLAAVAALAARRVVLLELVGAVAVIVGLVLWLGPPAGWVGAGVALLGKSLEADLDEQRKASGRS